MTYIADVAAAIRAEVDERLIPDGDTGLLFLFYAVLLLSKGRTVTAEDVHNSWSAWMTYNEESHESIVEFSDLDENSQAKDQPFVDAIHRVVLIGNL